MGCDAYGVRFNHYANGQYIDQATLWLTMESEPHGCLCTFPGKDGVSKERVMLLALLGAAVLQVYQDRPAGDDECFSTRTFIPQDIREGIARVLGIEPLQQEQYIDDGK